MIYDMSKGAYWNNDGRNAGEPVFAGEIVNHEAVGERQLRAWVGAATISLGAPPEALAKSAAAKREAYVAALAKAKTPGKAKAASGSTAGA